MSKEEQLYNQIAGSIKDGIKSQMFGCPCIKAANGKAAFCFRRGDLVIKLDKEDEKEALSLDGNELFAPKGGRPMGGGWVQIPFSNADTWKKFAQRSFAYVAKLEANDKKAPAKKASKPAAKKVSAPRRKK